MDLKHKLEALLFVSAKPMAVKQLAEFTEAAEEEVREACHELTVDYKDSGRGMTLIENGGKFQMVTAPEAADTVAKMVKVETSGELSRPSLEALTIIAYRGPISKTDLDRIRGVNCSLIIRNLLLRGLIEAKEGSEDDGTHYNVSFDFLKFLGLGSVEDLPDFARLHMDTTVDEALADEEPLENPVI
ncbi:MAG: SMC-Scp complex subunit ScpB [Candidatus Falkowbacteria bacterium]